MALLTILLLSTWALGVWFRPIGPPVRGVYWASFVVAIVVVSLLLLVASVSAPPRALPSKRREELKGVEIRPLTPAQEQQERERDEAAAAASLNLLFWVLLVVALIALVVHYAFPGLT